MIPDHIEFAVEGSLYYSGEAVKVDLSTIDQISKGTISINVQVSVGGIDYPTNEEGKILDPETGEEIILTTKLPFANYNVGFVAGADVLYIPDNNKVYVAHRNNYLQLNAVNAADANKTSNKVEKWDFVGDACGVTLDDNVPGRLNLSGATLNANKVCEIVVKATANNMDGEVIEKDITVVVVKPIQATIAIGTNNIAFTGAATVPTLTFNGVHTSYAININATYSGDSEGNAPLQPTPVLTVENEDGLIYENKKLTFKTNNAGELAQNSNHGFTAIVDGIFSKNVNVNVIDATAAAVKFNYKQYAQAGRPEYYIGTSGAIKISDLFTISNSEKFGSGAKLTIYAFAYGNAYLSSGQEINNVYNTYKNTADAADWTLYAEYDRNLTASNWNTAKIEFKGSVTEQYSVFIEIAPENDVSTVAHVEIVNGAINVTDMAGLAKTHTTDVVLHKGVTITSGNKIDLGAKNLYGNGWIINAKSFVSSSKTVGDHFISVTNGTIDNVYIDGPVYPELEYESSTNGYHVSGVKVTGVATIQNSYIAGFRQPVQLSSGALSVTNSTLYGGTYANLQMLKGTLTLTDVTTVQPQHGIADTFNTTNKKNVIGLGIVVEDDAVDGTTSAITINGYLDQYNWVPENSKADFPILTIDGSKMDMKKVLAAMFNGMVINFIGKDIERKLAFLDAYMETVDGVKYLNAGIMFMSIAPKSQNIASSTCNNASKLTVTDSRTNGGSTATTKFTEQPLPLFSTYVVMQKSIFKLYASQAMRLLEDFTLGDDGIVRGSVGINVLNSIANPIDVYFKVWTYNKDAVNLGSTGYPINQTQGYYINYGN